MVLRAHFRKLYGEHKSVSVGGGVPVVGASPTPTATKTIEHKPSEYVDMTPIEASQEEEARRGGLMVVTATAKTSEELEAVERRLRESPIDVEFIEADDDETGSDATAGND